MALYANASIDLNKIDKTKLAKNRYLNLLVKVYDNTDQYGNNVSVQHSQSKEEREAKADPIYLGNGGVFWTNNQVQLAERKVEVTNAEQNSSRSIEILDEF